MSSDSEDLSSSPEVHDDTAPEKTEEETPQPELRQRRTEEPLKTIDDKDDPPKSASIPSVSDFMNPETFGSAYTDALNFTSEKILPNGRYSLFLATWLPFLLTGIASTFGFLLSYRGRHLLWFLILSAAYFYIITLKEDDGKIISYAKMASTFGPALMIDNSGYWFTDLWLMIAVCTGPMLLEMTSFKWNTKDPLAVNLLKVTPAGIATFIVASGGEGWFNGIMLALIYEGASHALPFVLDPVQAAAGAFIPPQLKNHPEALALVVQTLVAKVVLYLLYIVVLPPSLFEEQNNMFVDLFFTAVGLGTVIGSLFALESPDLASFKPFFPLANFGVLAVLAAGYLVNEAF